MPTAEHVNMMDLDDQSLDNLYKLKAPKLPISKVKKIARCDPEYVITSNSAFIATAFATEIFIKNFAEETIVLSQLSSTNGQKVKRITYADLAKTVQRHEKFHFLTDVIPITKNLKTLVKQNKVRYSNVAPSSGNQRTLPFQSMSTNTNDSKDEVNSGDEIYDENDDIEEAEEEEDDEDDDAEDEDELEAKTVQEQKDMQDELKKVEQLNYVIDLDKEDSNSNDEEINDHYGESDEE
ncbi:hypothetical protein TPHA_0I01210 [Tetrapisispora phaffii CBS 4417]|uniref:Transcription factor CBF/NF-Y/archaeal histone domain-containing protein n=1 Tax=Tetrapisispora phaffii (strain ATCC 24235 / CBS 4417 / NBRC 1672 / NRRL Y-8282 / UCD 70-5) TaxID=1071381 RepID=G8BXJ9_TETPH|nr:hypothetical protein TPHA_0I01210 [Tetrapisispora phaffii CBS 4417]CCE64627.1 hypothetical protein TPHA_0I01210 [Tetrapisispora phaffii CBS 4417]